MDCKSIYSGKMYSKWVTVFVLFFSLITFSNNSISITFQNNACFQTEWVFERHKHFNTPLLFQKAAGKIVAPINEWILRNFAFNRLLAVKLGKLAETFLSMSAVSGLFVQEANLQYPTEAVYIN